MPKSLCYWHFGSVLKHHTVNTVNSNVLRALSFKHCVISTVLKGNMQMQCYFIVLQTPSYKDSVVSNVLKETWPTSREFTLFQCKLQYVAKYAFLCYFFGAKYSSVLLFTLFPSLIYIHLFGFILTKSLILFILSIGC